MKSITENWREHPEATDFDPDDEELGQTPKDVILTLGFDPKIDEETSEKPLTKD